jgi:toxin ParE1/3/4
VRGRVERTDRSVSDIIEHALFIAREQPTAARRFVQATADAIEKLAVMPNMGAIRESQDPDLTGLRHWPIKGFRNFLIVYRPLRDGIVVVRILHGAQDIDRTITK